ncbi:MAG TPA: protein kinase, partial [Polyangiaceae bacterium]
MAASPMLQAFLARSPEERRLGAFHLHSQLGRGGFAPVWLASEVYDDIELRSVAVKLFSLAASEGGGPIRRYREHVVREARALCRVEHPNIVRFYSLVIEDELGLVALV